MDTLVYRRVLIWWTSGICRIADGYTCISAGINFGGRPASAGQPMDTLVYRWIFGGRPASAGQPMDTLVYQRILILVDVRHLPDI